MSDDAAVRVENVSVQYDRRVVIDQVSFEVPRGAVYALLGRNGAGKSSLMRCLLGLQKPSRGRVLVFGEDVWPHRARLLSRAAYVPEAAEVPSRLRVLDVVGFYEAMYPTWDRAAMRARLQRVGVSDTAVVSALSKGQRALLTLALALSSKPELLVLDDPTLGLDVVARGEFFSDFIGELADRGTTVIMTTHDLAGVEGIADRVGILQGGRLGLDENVDEMRGARGRSLEQVFIEVTKDPGRAS